MRWWFGAFMALRLIVTGLGLAVIGGLGAYLGTVARDPDIQGVGVLVCVAGIGTLVLGVLLWPRAMSYHLRRVRRECGAGASSDEPASRFDLVLLNDDTHSFEYVIAVLRRGFGLSYSQALALARDIDAGERGVVFTGTRCEVERMREWVLARGPDPAVPTSTGPLQVLVEQVE
jgi:ATP-dependent Clp protease adaptor protein ClpS